MQTDREPLFDLFEALRRAGFRIDVRHLIGIHELIGKATAAGLRVDDPDRLRMSIGPLVCKSASDQREFARVFDEWVKRGSPARRPSASEDRHRLTETLERAERNSGRWRWLLIVPFALVCLFVLISYFELVPAWAFSNSIVPPPEPTAAEIASARPWLSRLAWATLLLGVAAVVYLLLWYRFVRQFLKRESHTPPPSLEHLSIQVPIPRLYEGRDLAKAASSCRARLREPGRAIDVEATIGRTVTAGGRFSQVLGVRRVSPDYLVLIEREGPSDQQTAFVDDLLDQLALRGVWIQRYYFRGDPRLCFPERSSDSPATIAQLAGRFPRYRLLVFAESRVFADPVTGGPAAWVAALEAWADRVVFLPGGRRSADIERRLSGFIEFVPATLAGIVSAMSRFARPGSRPAPLVPLTAPPPRGIDDERWVERFEPQAQERAGLIAALESVLTPRQFVWLSACAAYPMMHWNLTMRLGAALDDDAREAELVTPSSIATLVQLPWFRHGTLPDWLRGLLVDRLSAADRRVAEATLNVLMLRSIAGAASDVSIQIAASRSRLYQRLALLARRIAWRSGDLPQEWNDYIFRRFTIGRRSRSLAERLGGAVSQAMAASRAAQVAMTVARNPETRRSRLLAAASYVLFPFAFVGALSSDRYVRYNAGQALMLIALSLVAGVAIAPLVGNWNNGAFAAIFFVVTMFWAVPAWWGRPARLPGVSAFVLWVTRERVSAIVLPTVSRTFGQRAIGILLCRPSVYAEVARDRRSIWLALLITAVGAGSQLFEPSVRLPADVPPETAALVASNSKAYAVVAPFVSLTEAVLMWLFAIAIVRIRPAVAPAGRPEPPRLRHFITATGIGYVPTALRNLVVLAVGVMSWGESTAALMVTPVFVFWVLASSYALVRGAMYQHRRGHAVVVLFASSAFSIVLVALLAFLLAFFR